MSGGKGQGRQRPASAGGPRTRGGWVLVGTAADRRTTHATNGTARGQRTRRSIIDAARRIFERQGYLDTNVDDIVTEAGVARGTFYTYFQTKLDVFNVVAQEVEAKVLEAVTHQAGDDGLDPVTTLERVNRRFVEVYREHAQIYALLEQVATIDLVSHDQRLRARRLHVERVADRIARCQARGLADPSVDLVTTAGTLVSMISNFCYWWLVGGDTYDEDTAISTLTNIWVRAVGLRAQPEASQLTQVQGK